jgi:hypothetical protein
VLCNDSEVIKFFRNGKMREENFGAVLDISSIGHSIRILMLILSTMVEAWQGSNRVSASLHSGMSVSIALKEREQSHQHV